MTKAYLHSLPPHAKPSPSTKSNYTTQLQPKSPLNTMSMTANYHWQVVLSSTVIQSHNLQQLEALHHHSSTLDHQDTFLIHHHNLLSSNWNLHYIDIHHQCIHMEAGIHRYCVILVLVCVSVHELIQGKRKLTMTMTMCGVESI